MAGAGVCASFDHSGRGPGAAFEAPRCDLDCQLSRNGSVAGGAGELSGPAGLGSERWDAGDIFFAGVGEGIFAGARDAVASGVRHGEAVLAEPALREGKFT